MRRAVLLLALVLAGCGAIRRSPPPVMIPPAPSAYPTVADYNTIKLAAVFRDKALRDRDWRHQSFSARLALMTLMTIRPMQPGRCADYVNALYDELLSLNDNYKGEDWRPLIVLMRHDPPLRVCRPDGALHLVS